MDGVHQMVAFAKRPHHKVLVGLCGLAGLRVSEAREISVDWIDLQGRLLRVLGKGEVERTVPISDALLPILVNSMAYAREFKLVPLSDSSARAIITSIGIRTLGHHVASHDLRMTFGTAVNDKYGVRTAQELLGHASIETTQGYTLVTMQTLREAVEL